MDMEETGTEIAGASENGICVLEKTGEAITSNKVEENNGVKEMEEDNKEDEKAKDTKMDEDQELKEEKENTRKEGKKEDEGVEMEEENDVKEEKGEEKSDDKAEEKAEECKVDREKAEECKMETEKVEESKEEKGSKKRGKRISVGKVEVDNQKDLGEKKFSESVTPVSSSLDRPVRERKSVERLVVSIEKEGAKEFRIEKGRGTSLMDIPNVAYKLARKKSEDSFKLLHTIIFGRRGKANQIKNNISNFSGFVWHENEEKQKLKVKEKMDKCVKEKLLEFCDVLDIPVAKTTTRKEDIVTKLLDFLEAPHATSDILLAEKEQSSKVRKRKRVVKRRASKSGDTPAKLLKRRKSEGTPKMKKNSATETEEESEQDEKEIIESDVPDVSEDELPEPSESEKEDESEEESDDTGKRKHVSKNSSKKNSSGKSKTKVGKSKTKNLKTPQKPAPAASPKKPPSKLSSKVDNSGDGSPKVFSRKKKNEEAASKISTPMKTPTKEKTKEKNGKKVEKGEDKPKRKKSRPSDEELRNTICGILKEVDFNTATFTDILKQLARHYDMDLTPRKASIKLIIQEELTKLAEEEEAEEEDDPESAGKEVEAAA